MEEEKKSDKSKAEKIVIVRKIAKLLRKYIENLFIRIWILE